MLPKDESFPKRPPTDDNFSLPVPIVSLPSSESSVDSTARAALPRVTADLPPRCRNEPAVLACSTGEVRRMRSVLDMKLGAMAVSLDTRFAAPDGAELFVDDPEDDKRRERRPDIDNVADKNRLSRSRGRCGEMFDAFGIAIPRSTQAKMERDGPVEPVYGKTGDAWENAPAYPTTFKSDTGCSVVLVESPSRLDLSALLC